MTTTPMLCLQQLHVDKNTIRDTTNLTVASVQQYNDRPVEFLTNALVDRYNAHEGLVESNQNLVNALNFIKQWFTNLEGDDLGDPLRAIRLRCHAPVHKAIDEALVVKVPTVIVG